LRYTKEQLKQLRDRWHEPLLDPETMQPTEIEDCKTFQELLTKRMKEIDELLLTEIENLDESLSGFKKRREYQRIWKEVDNCKFSETLNDIKKFGLENYSELTDTEKHAYKRDYAIDLRGAVLNNMHFDGADLIFASFDSAKCESTHFKGAACRDAHFDGTDCKSADFTIAGCLGINFADANCRNAIFNGTACFEANFNNANCEAANFKNSDCSFSRFVGAVCSEANFENAKCEHTRFDNADCWKTSFNNADCTLAHFDGADCSFAHFDDGILDNASISTTEIMDENNRIRCRNCELGSATYKNARFVGVDTSKVDWSKNPAMRRYIEHQQFVEDLKAKASTWWQKSLIKIWEISSGYGQNFWRWLGISFAIILLFSIIYSIIDYSFLHFGSREAFVVDDRLFNTPRWFYLFYFSIVTFSTLGSGDVAPIHWLPMVCIALQVFLGYLMLGGLITFLANWLGRK